MRREVIKTSAALLVGLGVLTLAPGRASACAGRCVDSLPSANKLVSVDVKDADIHNVLRALADVSKMNFIVAEEVSGKVTLHLRNVRWADALQAVLQTKGLGMERRANILRVAPLKTLADEAAVRANASRLEFENKPLRTRIIPVNYARAEDMVGQIKATLTSRGSVTVDTRTNSLIVRDVD